MRAFVLLSLALVFSLATASAECTYFRTSAKLQKCTAADLKTQQEKNPYDEPGELPDLPSSEGKVLARLVCSCQYVLKGAGLLCDSDQTVEHSVIMGGEALPEICRQAKQQCKEICPKSIP